MKQYYRSYSQILGMAYSIYLLQEYNVKEGGMQHVKLFFFPILLRIMLLPILFLKDNLFDEASDA